MQSVVKTIIITPIVVLIFLFSPYYIYYVEQLVSVRLEFISILLAITLAFLIKRKFDSLKIFLILLLMINTIIFNLYINLYPHYDHKKAYCIEQFNLKTNELKSYEMIKSNIFTYKMIDRRSRKEQLFFKSNIHPLRSRRYFGTTLEYFPIAFGCHTLSSSFNLISNFKENYNLPLLHVYFEVKFIKPNILETIFRGIHRQEKEYRYKETLSINSLGFKDVIENEAYINQRKILIKKIPDLKKLKAKKPFYIPVSTNSFY